MGKDQPVREVAWSTGWGEINENTEGPAL